MPRPTLFTTGIAGNRSGDLDKSLALQQLAARMNFVVFDVRMCPENSDFVWRPRYLKSILGDVTRSTKGRYVALPEFGNIYDHTNQEDLSAPDAKIEIANLSLAIEYLANLCDELGTSPLLLGAYEHPEDCHRSRIGDAFAGIAGRWLELQSWLPQDASVWPSGRNSVSSGSDVSGMDCFGKDMSERWGPNPLRRFVPNWHLAEEIDSTEVQHV